MRRLIALLLLSSVALAYSEPTMLPHEEHQLQFGQWQREGFEPKPIPRARPAVGRCRPMTALSHEVYGFLPYWEYGSYTPPRFDLISRIAYFSVVLNELGNVSVYRDWPTLDLVDSAHAHGCKVDLCIAVFDDDDIGNIVNNPVNRSNACRTICEQMALGADGVNVDFELPGSSAGTGFYAFMRELADSVHSRGTDYWVSVCLPSVDWRGTFDTDSLLPHLDALFLMGYGYYWSGSSQTGPVAPMDDPGCYYDLAYSMDRYCGSDHFKRSRFIVGLPLYGYDWPCTGPSRGASTTGSGSARVYTTCISDTVSYGCNWDSDAPCPWYVYGSYRQCWWDDARSLDIKYRWAVYNDLMGIGFWAIGYDGGNDEIWDGVEAVFGGDIPRDTIIDDYSIGFEREGDDVFWHPSDTGFNHHMWWTYSTVATDPDDDTCYCTWTPNLPDRRYYEVFTYIPAINSVASSRYAIDHDFGYDTVIVRQASYFDEWVSLGAFSFEKGHGGKVYLGDGTGTVGEKIGFDAIWWSDRGALPAPDTLVTISSDGFRWGGPIEWRRIVPGGYEGIYYWTNSMTHGPDVSSARWVPNLPSDGDYEVYIYIPAEHSEDNCVYKIGHSSGLSEVVIDQSLYSDEWVYLGYWHFTAADSPYVYLGDSTGTTGENIAVDGAVWRTHIVGIAELELPEKAAISVYPNPFNSSVKIRVSGFGSRVSGIEIFDISGRKVEEMPSSSVPLPKGEGRESLLPLGEGGSESRMRAEFIWQPDESVGSGIYFVRSAGCYKKITLLR